MATRQVSGLTENLANLHSKIGIDYEGIGVCDENGIILTDSLDPGRAGITISEREYFHTAKKNHAAIIGPAIPSKATGRPVFVLFAPVVSQEGHFLGGVLAVVKADYLMRYISSLKLGKTGYAFMIDQTGCFIAHPNPQLILKYEQSAEPGVRLLTKRMINQETGTIDYLYQGKVKVAGFTPVALTGWSIAVAQQKDEIMALAYTNRNYVLLVSCFFLTATILAVFYFSRAISNPVQNTLDMLNHAIEQATEAFSIIGLDQKVQFVNPAMARILDRPIQELIGNAPILDNTGNISSEDIWCILKQGKFWMGVISGFKQDGSQFFMNITIDPVRDNTGNIGSFLAIGRDISRELMIESQLRQSQKMEAIGTLAGGIAHDFNNMLSVIIGNTELAMEGIDAYHPVQKQLKDILHAGNRSAELTRQLLAFARKQTATPMVLNLNDKISGMLKMLQRLINEDINLVWLPGKELWKVKIDPTQVDQILANLTINARDAIEKTGHIVIQTSNEVCDENYCIINPDCIPGEYVILSVSDNGVGMEKDTLAKIFDPFFTTKKEGHGTGLGLAIIYGITRQNGGFIHVYSEPGQGSTFKIHLPRCEDDHLGIEVIKDAAEIKGGTETVLIVEDEIAVQILAQQMLEKIGYHVLTATKTAEAIRLVKEYTGSIDLLITDVVMPDMNGKELSEHIALLKPGFKCLFMSGYTADVIARQGILDQGVHFIAKPFTFRELAIKVREVIDA